MRVVMFYHSLRSDWNHGNAHFLRGVVGELQARGHTVTVYEPEDGWSLMNLQAAHGLSPLRAFHEAYPGLRSVLYAPHAIDLERALDGADLVIVHEWNDAGLVRRIGECRAETRSFRLFFHDTHHRSVTEPDAMADYDLSHYDGVLAFGAVIRDLYLERGWAARAWTWHEAADTRVFFPRPAGRPQGDLVWIGNWGDGERADELRQFLLDPIAELGLRARFYGVRYPKAALAALVEAGIEYGGWVANYEVPNLFARYRVTAHVPRRPYVERLPGIPTIRVFEALACGIPLVSAAWEDAENLFTPGRDFLMARDGAEMTGLLRDVLADDALAGELAAHGLETIGERHTCAHRVDELLKIVADLNSSAEGKGKAE